MMFTKSLTLTDIESRLVLDPTKEWFFREFWATNNGGNEAVNIFFRNQNGQTWSFRMSRLRRAGSGRSKVVVSAGWLSFVRDRKLKTGDWLSIFKDTSNGNRVLYGIQVKRREKSADGSDKWTCLV